MDINVGDLLIYDTPLRKDQLGTVYDILKVVDSVTRRIDTIVLFVQPMQMNLDTDIISTTQITGRYRKF